MAISNMEMRDYYARKEARDHLLLDQSAEQIALATKHTRVMEERFTTLFQSLEKPTGFKSFLHGFSARLPPKGPWRNAFLVCVTFSALLAYAVAIATLIDFIAKRK